MRYDASELMPGHPRSLVRRVEYRVPLTPHFFPPASSATMRTRGFYGSDFFRQNKSTRNSVYTDIFTPRLETDEPICGFAAYRILTTVDANPMDLTPENGTKTLSYKADTAKNTYEVEEKIVGNVAIGLTYNRTATTGSQHELEYVNGEWEEYLTTFTLSEEVTKVWLQGQMEQWYAQNNFQFIYATREAVSAYDYTGYCATTSEGDGSLAIVSGGDVVAEGYYFRGAPQGMSGDEGEKWNGKYSTYLRTVLRDNAPVLHRESSVIEPSVVGDPPGVAEGGSGYASGVGIYRDGYAEIQLEDPSEKWLDEWGVYASGTSFLEPEDRPLEPVMPSQFALLLSYATGEEAANRLWLMSRTGKSYRVTIQIGDSDWDGSAYVFFPKKTEVLVTYEDDFAAATFFDSDDYSAGREVRVAKIEEKIVEDGGEKWIVIADVELWKQDPALSPLPESLIGPDVVGDYLLFAAVQYRRGSRFGHPALDGSGGYYLKKTFRKHLTPGAFTAQPGECGLSGITGSADLEWYQEYDEETGLIGSKNVAQNSLVLNGTFWGWYQNDALESLNFPGSQLVTSTSTLRRRVGSHEFEGRYVIKYDMPDPQGRDRNQYWTLVSEKFVFNDSERILFQARMFGNPPEGTSIFFEGHRLTYGVEAEESEEA